jgi:hypothetical protein
VCVCICVYVLVRLCICASLHFVIVLQVLCLLCYLLAFSYNIFLFLTENVTHFNPNIIFRFILATSVSHAWTSPACFLSQFVSQFVPRMCSEHLAWLLTNWPRCFRRPGQQKHIWNRNCKIAIKLCSWKTVKLGQADVKHEDRGLVNSSKYIIKKVVFITTWLVRFREIYLRSG